MSGRVGGVGRPGSGRPTGRGGRVGGPSLPGVGGVGPTYSPEEAAAIARGGRPVGAVDAVPVVSGVVEQTEPPAVTVPATSVSTRERLLIAARSVVEEHGYAGASVAAIAGRAGVANGTLYRHFGSKEELFVEVFRAVCGGEVRAMEEAAGRVEQPEERVLAALGAFARRALQNPTLAWALLAEPVDPQVDAVRIEYRRAYRALLVRPLRDALDAGRIPPQDPELTAAALVGAAGEVLVGPLAAAGGRRADPDGGEAVVDALVGVCRRAVGAAGSVAADAPRLAR